MKEKNDIRYLDFAIFRKVGIRSWRREIDLDHISNILL
jgi:hypothetical protein